MPSPPTTLPRIVLPPIHPGQVVIDQGPARFKVVFYGRRGGKTTYGVRKCTKGALTTGGLYWWIAPSYKVASIGWRMLKKLAWQINEVSPVEIREADMEITFKANGGRIAIKSADNPDSLRGESLDGVVFDEFAQIKEDTWGEVIRPSLTDRKGWALFIGTPKGKNWAYRIWEQAKERPDWEAIKVPTAVTKDGTAYTEVIASTNPYINKDELEQARLYDMSPEKFAQEFLADFGMSQYLVYAEIDPAFHEWRGPIPEFVGNYYTGWDFGGDTIGAHNSVTVVAGRTARDELIIFDAFKQAGPNIAERQLNWFYDVQNRLGRVHRELKRRPPAFIGWGDKSQMLGIQYLRKMGITIFKTKGGPDSVSEGIELVHRRLTVRPGATGDDKPRPRLFVTKDCPWVLEDLMKYRYPEPHGDGRVEKENPMKVDDDTPDAVRYLVEGVDRTQFGDPMSLYGSDIPRIG